MTPWTPPPLSALVANDMPLLAAVYACDVASVERLASQSGARIGSTQFLSSDDVITRVQI